MFSVKKTNKLQLRPFIWALFILAVLAGLFFLYQNRNQRLEPARAGINHKVYGWAWSNTIGWISFNSTNCDANDDGLSDGSPPDCPAAGSPIPDYGVDVDTSCTTADSYCSFKDDSVNNSPYAWSNHIGWIDFTPEPDYGLYPGCGYPSDPCHGGRIDITELFINPNKNIYGWAKINTLGEAGWLKLKKGPADSGPDYGVYIQEDAEFMGWAWNANDDGSGIGWVSFNCENQGSCGAVDYFVRGSVPPVPQNLTVARTPDWTCSSLIVDWDPSIDVLSYQVFRRLPPDGSAQIAPVVPDGPLLTSDNYTDYGLAYGTTYYYKVRACNIFGCSDFSAEVPGTTNSVCIVNNDLDKLYAVGECPNTVHLFWNKPLSTNIDYFIVKRCDETNDDCTSNDNFYSEVPSGSGCYRSYNCDASDQCRCDDDSIAAGDEAAKVYRYIITGVNTIPDPDDYGDWSDPSGEVQPCPGAPSWREVKP